MAFSSRFSAPKTHKLNLITTKTADKSQLKDVLQNTWPALLKTAKVTKHKKSLRDCHSQEEPKEPWPLSGMWCPEWDPGKAAGKTEDIQIKYGLKEAKNIVSESVH